MVNVAHFSDLHGLWRFIPQHLPFLEDKNGPVELLINTGDFFPNVGRPIDPVREAEFQTRWFETNRDGLFQGFGDRPIVTVDGNHDFVCLGKLLVDYGYQGEVFTITPGVVHTYKELTFAGFSHIPYIAGEWNREVQGEELRELAQQAVDTGAEILVTHVPPAGILAGVYGSTELANILFYQPHSVRVHMFGHVHADGGMKANECGIYFSNAACNISVFEI
jgi:Icc-related predicted phosphoesterase